MDEIKAAGADFVKIYNDIPRDAYFALADEAHKQNIPFVGHLPYGVRASEASDAGQRSIEHLDGIAIACSKHEQSIINELRPLHYLEKMNLVAEAIRSYDSTQCQALFAQFRRNGTWQVPTLTVHRGMAFLNDSRFTSDARLAYMSGDVRRRWQPENDFRFRRWPPAEFELHRGLFSADKQLVGIMFPAEFLGRTEEFGVIAPGKRAGLVLLSADPLVDIHNTAQIQAVWHQGKYFDRTALDRLLEDAKHRSGKGALH